MAELNDKALRGVAAIADMLGPEAAERLKVHALSDKASGPGQTIKQLSALKNGLEHAAVCPAPSHMECPSFRRLPKIATSRTSKSPSAHRSPRGRGVPSS